MKKLLSLLLALLVLISSSLTVFAQYDSKVTFSDGQFVGITSGNQRTVATQIFQNTTITINHLDIHDDVNITGNINTLDGNVSFHFFWIRKHIQFK